MNNNETEKGFSEELAREVTDLFFGQMMGLNAYQRRKDIPIEA